VCVKDYARDENVLQRVDPVFGERRFNPAPVRIIIDKQGKVKHTHFSQRISRSGKSHYRRPVSSGVSDHSLRDGKPVEVETGIMFGRAPRRPYSRHLKP